jgi:putative membrane protein
MKRFLVRLLINAVAFWLTALIVAGVHVVPYSPGDALASILTFLLVALIFGVVNGVIGTVIRVVAFPIYILTLGLFSLVVNAVLLLIVSGISSAIGFGLRVDNFGWGVIGAIVLAFVGWIIGVIIRPITGANSRG